MTHAIFLDREIRDWVLFPIFFIMVMVGIIRHYATVLMKTPTQVAPQQYKEAQTLQYARYVMGNGHNISYDEYKAKVDHLVAPQRGLLQAKVENNQMASMMDPTMMGDMMKRNVVMIIPNIGMMSIVSYFFAGFVVAKFPFPLTDRFREMVQRGVDIDNLNCSYVTSLSMYFLTLFGLQGVLQLLLGENEGDETQLMQRNLGMGGGEQQAMDTPKVFKATAEELELALDHYHYALQNVEEEIMRK